MYLKILSHKVPLKKKDSIYFICIMYSEKYALERPIKINNYCQINIESIIITQ